MSTFVANLRGVVSEPSRTLIAKRLATIIGESFNLQEFKVLWATRACPTFLEQCQLTCPERWVDDSLAVSETDLAAFCNKWMQVSHFKLADSDEYQVMTPELNGLRYTMVEELKSLAKKLDSDS
jgi:hypothetical protein